MLLYSKAILYEYTIRAKKSQYSHVYHITSIGNRYSIPNVFTFQNLKMHAVVCFFFFFWFVTYYQELYNDELFNKYSEISIKIYLVEKHSAGQNE